MRRWARTPRYTPKSRVTATMSELLSTIRLSRKPARPPWWAGSPGMASNPIGSWPKATGSPHRSPTTAPTKVGPPIVASRSPNLDVLQSPDRREHDPDGVRSATPAVAYWPLAWCCGADGAGSGITKSAKKLGPLSDSSPPVRPPGMPTQTEFHNRQRSSFIRHSPVPPAPQPSKQARRIPAHLNPIDRTSVMTSITPFLWLDNNVREAVAFYKSVFPNAKVETVNDFMATFELEGQRFNALNGGPKYKFNEAISFFISVETQEEVDYFWNRLIADGGEESRCGWLKDKFGLSWQVVPTPRPLPERSRSQKG